VWFTTDQCHSVQHRPGAIGHSTDADSSVPPGLVLPFHKFAGNSLNIGQKHRLEKHKARTAEIGNPGLC